MNFLQSVFLGLVQGITEFLPVSSSGHLMIFEQLMHFEGDIEFFNVFLHVGTLFAIMIGMQRDIVKLFKAFVAMAKDCFYNIRLFMKSGSSEKEPHYRRIISNNYRKLVLIIIIATIPTAIIGYVLNSFVGGGSYSLIMVGIGMLISGVLMMVVSRVKPRGKLPRDIGLSGTLLTGVAQGMAVLPGISRSGAVITCGILLGFSTRLSIRFSYLLSIPAVIGALILELSRISTEGTVTIAFIGCCAAGAFTAMIVGLLVIHAMMHMVGRRGIGAFSLYCFVIGFAVILLSYLI